MGFCAWYFAEEYIHWVISIFLSKTGRLRVKPCN